MTIEANAEVVAAQSAIMDSFNGITRKPGIVPAENGMGVEPTVVGEVGRDRFVNWGNPFMRIAKAGEIPAKPEIPY